MANSPKAFFEVIDLFARGATPADIIAFRPSEESQLRARYLLTRNENGELTAEESHELESMGEIGQLMQLVKARAKYLLNQNLM